MREWRGVSFTFGLREVYMKSPHEINPEDSFIVTAIEAEGQAKRTSRHQIAFGAPGLSSGRWFFESYFQHLCPTVSRYVGIDLDVVF